MSNHRFSPDMQILFFRETSGQETTEVAVYLSEPSQRYTLAQFRTDDPAANPGAIVALRGGGGGRGGAGAAAAGGGRGGCSGPGGGLVMVSADKTSVFYQGTLNDKNPDQVGPKTFIDRVAIKTGEKKRLYESDNKDALRDSESRPRSRGRAASSSSASRPRRCRSSSPWTARPGSS